VGARIPPGCSFLDSPFGRVIVGIRVNEQRMRSIGYRTFRYKLVCFVLSGMLAGMAGYFAAAQFGFVNPETLSWHQSGGVLMMVILGGMGTLTGADCCSRAMDVNDLNEVVGWSLGARYFAVLWRDGTIEDLGALDGRNTVAVAINADHRIVGNSDVWIPIAPFHQSRAFAWYEGVLTELTRLGDSSTIATDINDNNVIVGVSSGYAVRWQDGEIRHLSSPPCLNCGGPRALNNAGHAVGIGDVGQEEGAVLWKDNSRFDLNRLIPQVPRSLPKGTFCFCAIAR